MEEQRRVLVTGANGYIGSHVVSELLKADCKVIACDFKNTNIASGVDFKSVDVLNAENHTEDSNLYESLGKPEILIHLAWQDGFNHYAPSHIEKLNNHFSFLKYMIDSGCKSISVMGTAHEVGYFEGKIDENTSCNPLSYYGISKNALKQLLFVYGKDKDVSLKWLRAYYILGDDSLNHSIFAKILEVAKTGQKEFPFTTGANKFDFIHINELAKMIVKSSLQNEVEGIIDVCSGEPITIKDKVEEFIKEHNLDIKLKLGAFPSRKYDSPVIYGDNTKIKKIMEK